MPTVPRSTRPKWMPERKEHWSESPASKIHNGSRWRKLSLAHKRQNPLCVMCLKKGISKPVEITDHIVAIRDGGDPYAWDNMQSLCKACSMVKTVQEANERKKGAGADGAVGGGADHP